MKNITFFFLFLSFSLLNAQSWGDYTLIARQNANSVSLINLDKVAVKTWALTGNTGYSTYLLPGGDLLRSVNHPGNSFSGGGMTGKIQKVDFNGTILWDYVYSTSTYCMHHDICPLPNGNVLIIAYESKTAIEVTAAGGNFNNTIWSEKIVELQPSGLNTANIVWEWHLWDHLAQNVDNSKANYVSSIVNNPQLMNINYGLKKDWVHMNGIDYNSATDQIVVSSHNLNELWVIDHSTTSAQAASHSGGNSGKGGDFLYRWGNPAAYGAAGTTVFNVVHDAHWVNEGPYKGHFAVFNNRGISSTLSSIDYILPNYNLTLGQAYLPTTYSARLPANGYSSNMSNSQELPNGNTLACVATSGTIHELNAGGTPIWTYYAGGTTPQARRYEASYLCPTPPTSAATASQNNACLNTTVTLNANATGQNLTYTWSSIPAGFSSTLATPSVTPSTSIVYTVTVTSNFCTTTSSVVVTVSNKVPQTPVIKQKGDSLISSALSGNRWYFNGNLLADTTNRLVPTISGAYQVQTIGVNGCKSALSPKYNFVYSSIFDISSAIFLEFFPNPTSGIVELKGNFLEKGDFELIIYNTQGQVLQTLQNVSTFDLSSYNNQLFFVVLRSRHFGTQIGKVLLER